MSLSLLKMENKISKSGTFLNAHFWYIFKCPLTFGKKSLRYRIDPFFQVGPVCHQVGPPPGKTYPSPNFRIYRKNVTPPILIF